MAINKCLSITTLNINGLNALIKRHNGRLDKNAKTFNMLPTETHLSTKDTYRLKVRGWEKTFHANGHDRKAGVAILISDKIDSKTKP